MLRRRRFGPSSPSYSSSFYHHLNFFFFLLFLIIILTPSISHRRLVRCFWGVRDFLVGYANVVVSRTRLSSVIFAERTNRKGLPVSRDSFARTPQRGAILLLFKCRSPTENRMKAVDLRDPRRNSRLASLQVNTYICISIYITL